MEFITDLTVIISEAACKDPGLKTFLQSHGAQKMGSSYRVRGTFEEILELSDKMFDAKHQINSSPSSHNGQASAQPRSVEVSAAVMDYMEQKCENQLNRIRGNSYVIETHPDLRIVHNKAGSTVQVTFRPSGISMEPLHGDFVRKRFITLYQRTASDLQVTSVPVDPHEHIDLQRRFPILLFKPILNKQKVTVTGPFMHIAKLKEFLIQNTQSSSRSPTKKVPAVAPSSRASVPSPPHSKDPEDEPCPICMEPIVTAQKKTLKCKHSFCRDCLKKAFEYKPVCPTCGQLYGTLTGTQPEGGKMKITKTSTPLPGYEKYGTIIINYYIPSGIQKEEHPNPGQPYDGVSRDAYLPDSSEGQRILKLLKRAFDQRLVFTVGRSTTSGRNNTVTWNDIHHKTSTHGGPTHYGYPDPDYLSRVQDELRVKGIK